MESAQSQMRVSGEMMQAYVGRAVTLIGKVTEEGNFVEACDGKRVEVILPPGESLQNFKAYVQFIGKVQQQQQGHAVTLEVWRMHDAGENFDMLNYNKAVELANGQYQNLFKD